MDNELRKIVLRVVRALAKSKKLEVRDDIIYNLSLNFKFITDAQKKIIKLDIINPIITMGDI